MLYDFDSLNDHVLSLRKRLAPFNYRLEKGHRLGGVKHQVGTYSVYLLTIDVSSETEERIFLYVGQTLKPKERLSKHKSEFFNVSCTPLIGKSKLYTEEILGSMVAPLFELTVLKSGLNQEQAKKAEMEVSTFLKASYGDAVLTSPRRGQNIKI